MSIVGYERVSSKGQNLDRQTDSLKQAGVEKIYSDKLSGKNMDRPELKKMMDYIREGDTLIVHSFDRLARSLPDLLSIVESLKTKKVILKSLKENLDTSTPSGEFQLAIFGALAQFERAIIAERRDEGIAIARAKGKHLGRPRIDRPSGFDKAYKAWKAGKQSAVQTYKSLDLSKTMFYSMVKEYESNRGTK